MKIAYVKFKEEKYNYTTNINGSITTIQDYFIGKWFNLGTIEDNMQQCIDCIVLEPGETHTMI